MLRPIPLPASSTLMLRVSTLLVVLSSAITCLADEEPELYFERDVRPLFKAACFHCHGESGVTEGGLDLRLARFAIAGGDSGEAISPGHAEESYLYQRVRDGEMPPDEGHRLTAKQVEVIRRWIDAGATTLRPEPEVLDGPLITHEERSHWAYQPVQRPEIPSVQQLDLVTNPIDAFILHKLEQAGYSFTQPASRPALIRRLSLDLHGIPPTQEAITELIEDDAPDAVTRMVDKLLKSPRYGERWGRHWLDVAGYADSEGYNIDDRVRPDAWRYRDYVIRAFNDDKPFDRFIVEQLAGDELITSPLNNLTPDDAQLLIATGFLRMAPDGTAGAVDDANVARNETIAETIKIVTSSLMGLTVGCAQCHDHRYDPIPQSDYYALRAIFDPALNWKQWKNPAQRRVSLYTDEDRKLAAEIEEQAKEVEAKRIKKQNEFIQATFEKQLAELPEDIQDAARKAYETAARERTAEQKALLKKYPNLNVSAGSLYLYDQKAADELQALADEAKEIRETKPREDFVRALTEVVDQIPDSHLFARGDHDQPQQAVLPAGLTVVSLNAELPGIPTDDEQLKTSGRRLALARRLTHPQHPLTARVIVNRIWLLHFGKGLVTTPADFGTLGNEPTHPELLDWLAAELIDSGWSLKHLHRLILNSRTWQQSAMRSPELAAADPQNALYGAMDLRRLDAEAVRDSVLAIAGVLNEDLYGEPVPVMADNSGRWVLGIENLNAGRPGKVLPLEGDEYRRSIYVQARRSRPLAVMEPFDLPTMSPNCELRRSSTVTPQSLMLMNSEFALTYSHHVAARVQTECGDDLESQIQGAWQLVYGRPAENSEVVLAQEFIQTQTGHLTGRLPTSEGEDATQDIATEALANLCQMLLSSNEFLYIE